jgi:pimeloyl-ACP methyl ester carboxylesterase
VATRLSRHCRVIAPDMPGHGRSQGRLASIEEWRDAVGAVAAGLCLGPAILVGHSLGGAAALLSALAWPDKVAALVLVASAPRFPVSRRVFEILEQRFPEWPETFAELGYSPATPAEVRKGGAAMACSASREQTLRDYRAAAAIDLRDDLGRIRCPTWVFGGHDDLMAPARWSEVLAAQIPSARLFLLPRTGHMPMHEAPEVLAAGIREFTAGFPRRTD